MLDQFWKESHVHPKKARISIDWAHPGLLEVALAVSTQTPTAQRSAGIVKPEPLAALAPTHSTNACEKAQGRKRETSTSEASWTKQGGLKDLDPAD